MGRGAIFEDLNAMGINVVVRNYLGEVVATLSEIIPISSSMVTLKTIAARRAVQFIQELDLHSSMFEGDSEISISAIRDRCFSHPTCDHLIKDVLSSTSSFQNYSFSHILRQGNVLPCQNI